MIIWVIWLIIWLNIWWLFVIIWWLVVIIWWLFDHNYSWLFDDYSISAPAAGCLVCFISKSLRMEQWIIWVMAAFPLGILQPASLACYLLQKLRFICNNNLVFHGCFDKPSALPHSARSILLQEVPSHHSKSDCILHPYHESLLLLSRVYSAIRSQGVLYRL